MPVRRMLAEPKTTRAGGMLQVSFARLKALMSTSNVKGEPSSNPVPRILFKLIAEIRAGVGRARGTDAVRKNPNADGMRGNLPPGSRKLNSSQ